MSNQQGNLHLQMWQQRGSKTEEEESDDQSDQPEGDEEQGQSQEGLLGHYQHVQDMKSSSKMESKQPKIDNARCGKIVKVHGGHIVRSIARKDRHSKVYTSKGPRDRRFRLSAPTAIQFYDVQDRLGYDRPSKAIEWLIQKAKASIDALSEIPGKECDSTNTNSSTHQQTKQDLGEQSRQTMHHVSNHQDSNGELEIMHNVNPMNDVNRFKEAVFDPHQLSQVNYTEEALESSFNLSDSKVMEMSQLSWLQSLMAWNYNAGDGGDGCPFNSSHVSLQ